MAETAMLLVKTSTPDDISPAVPPIALAAFCVADDWWLMSLSPRAAAAILVRFIIHGPALDLGAFFGGFREK